MTRHRAPRFSTFPRRSRFEIHVDGRLAGFAQYRSNAGLLVFTHTEIDDAVRGPRARIDAGPRRTRRGPRPQPGRTPGLPVRPRLHRPPPDEYLDLVPEELRPRLGL